LRRSPLRYFAAVLALRPGLRFSNYIYDLWSYGDSNPRPLACHHQAAHPPPSITAGHRPRTSAPVPRDPRQLRYFPAVLPRRSEGVRAPDSRGPGHAQLLGAENGERGRTARRHRSDNERNGPGYPGQASRTIPHHPVVGTNQTISASPGQADTTGAGRPTLRRWCPEGRCRPRARSTRNPAGLLLLCR
jgi:hypothetical protein